MPKALTLLIIGTAAVLLSACTSLKCEHYVGVKEPIAENDIGEETIWRYRDKVYFLKVVDPQTVVASTLVWDDAAQRHQVVASEIALTKLDDHLFLNIRDEEERYYSIFRLSPSMDGPMVLFSVSRDKLEADIKAGRIEADSGKNSIVLKVTKAQLDAYVRENLFTLFNTDAAGLIFPINETNP